MGVLGPHHGPHGGRALGQAPDVPGHLGKAGHRPSRLRAEVRDRLPPPFDRAGSRAPPPRGPVARAASRPPGRRAARRPSCAPVIPRTGQTQASGIHGVSRRPTIAPLAAAIQCLGTRGMAVVTSYDGKHYSEHGREFPPDWTIALELRSEQPDRPCFHLRRFRQLTGNTGIAGPGA